MFMSLTPPISDMDKPYLGPGGVALREVTAISFLLESVGESDNDNSINDDLIQ